MKQFKSPVCVLGLLFILFAIIFIAFSMLQFRRDFEQNRRKRFPVSTVGETLASNLKNDTVVKDIHLKSHGNISYEVGGEGKVIVLLHCWAGARQYWKYTIRDLLHKYQVYALDLKGFGDSEKPSSGYRMRDFVSLLRDFFDAVGIKKSVLVGHSMGGAIALSFTLAYPEDVERLVLVALPASGHPIGHKLIGAPVIGGMWYRIVRFIGKHSLREPEARKIWLKPTVASATKSMKSFLAAKPLWEIQKINCPVLFVLGKNDPASTLAHPTTEATKLRSNLKLTFIEAARHSPQCENPPEFNRILLAYLEDDDSELILPLRFVE